MTLGIFLFSTLVNIDDFSFRIPYRQGKADRITPEANQKYRLPKSALHTINFSDMMSDAEISSCANGDVRT